MIKIAINQQAFDALAKKTLPLGSVAYEAERAADGQVYVWLDDREADRLSALRRPSDTLSDVIVRLAKAEGKGR
jgi:hypothetical protein